MKKIKVSDISWPRAMNLHVLSEILDEEELINLILKYAGKTRTERRIILPSKKCIKKCLSYYLVEKHEGNFDEVMRELKGASRFLKEAGLRRDKIKQLYHQRKLEILKERKREIQDEFNG